MKLFLFDFDGVLVLQAEFGRLILEREVVKAARLHRPFEFAFQVADEVGELADVAELVGHGKIMIGNVVDAG